MQQTVRALACLVCVTLVASAHGKIGETVPQLIQRFGKAYTLDTVEGGTKYKFRSANISVDVMLENGVSISETYLSDHPLNAAGEPPNDIVQAILRTNVPKAKWIQIEAAPFGANYALRSSDSRYIATLNYSGQQEENVVWTLTVQRTLPTKTASTLSPPGIPTAPSPAPRATSPISLATATPSDVRPQQVNRAPSVPPYITAPTPEHAEQRAKDRTAAIPTGSSTPMPTPAPTATPTATAIATPTPTATALFNSTANPKTIDGQVFIVTAGGPAIKLALVEVKLFARADIEHHIRDIDIAPDSESSKADTALAKARADLQAAERAVGGSHGYDEKWRGLAYAEWVRRHLHSDPHSSALEFNAAVERVSRAKEHLAQTLLRQRLSRSAAPYFENLPTPSASVKTDADGRFQITVPDEGDYVLVATSSRTLFNSTERYFWIVRVKPGDSKVTLSNDNLTTSGSPDSVVTTKY